MLSFAGVPWLREEQRKKKSLIELSTNEMNGVS
jgi:hypothetical protein